MSGVGDDEGSVFFIGFVIEFAFVYFVLLASAFPWLCEDATYHAGSWELRQGLAPCIFYRLARYQFLWTVYKVRLLR